MQTFNRAIADRVFHSLLVLGLVRAVIKLNAEDLAPAKKGDTMGATKAGVSGAASE
jgi:hypothetical protein